MGKMKPFLLSMLNNLCRFPGEGIGRAWRSGREFTP
jgi:hypothetical protein